MQALNNLLCASDNEVNTVYMYLRLLNVPVSRHAVKSALMNHPDANSLLSVSDTISGFGVENVAAMVSSDELDQISAPFLVRTQSGEGLSLAIVKEINHDSVTYMPSGQQRWQRIRKDVFLQDFQRLVLVGAVNDTTRHPKFAIDQKKEESQQRKIIFGILALPLLTVSMIILSLFKYRLAAIIPSLYTILSLAGIMVGSLLLWHEIDRQSALLKQVCAGGKRVNCDSILSSQASTVFGISWALIGFSYFAGSLLAILTMGIMNSLLFVCFTLLSLCALIYTAFSLYYQSRIAKQWCLLCLYTQGILILQAGLLFSNSKIDMFNALIPENLILPMITCYIIPFVLGLSIVPVIKKAREGEEYQKSLAHLKSNAQVLKALLYTQPMVTSPANGLGITLGREDARHRLIKVCNPYCGPCASAHVVIDEILAGNPDLQIQIIFTASDDDRDRKAAPARHLMAVSDSADEELLKQALDDWYLAETKDYSVFAAKYPVHDKLQQQGSKIKAMREWCDLMEIRFTPTFFLDGYQLPRSYQIGDLKKLRWAADEDI